MYQIIPEGCWSAAYLVVSRQVVDGQPLAVVSNHLQRVTHISLLGGPVETRKVHNFYSLVFDGFLL